MKGTRWAGTKSQKKLLNYSLGRENQLFRVREPWVRTPPPLPKVPLSPLPLPPEAHGFGPRRPMFWPQLGPKFLGSTPSVNWTSFQNSTYELGTLFRLATPTARYNSGGCATWKGQSCPPRL